MVSPDGRHLAFLSAETGESEVFVIDLDTNRRWRVSGDQGMGPTWSAARNEIYYAWEQGIYVVEFEMEPQFSPAVARLLHPHVPGELAGPSRSSQRCASSKKRSIFTLSRRAATYEINTVCPALRRGTR